MLLTTKSWRIPSRIYISMKMKLVHLGVLLPVHLGVLLLVNLRVLLLVHLGVLLVETRGAAGTS